MIIRNPSDALWIKMLAVDRSFQRNGIGRSLVDFIIRCNYSEDYNVKRISLQEKQHRLHKHRILPIYTECLIKNTNGLKFFQRLGFKIKKIDQIEGEILLQYQENCINSE